MKTKSMILSDVIASKGLRMANRTRFVYRRHIINRFDLIMIGVIVGLVTAIMVVITRGDGVNGAAGIPLGIIYLSPADASVQNLWDADPNTGGSPRQLTKAPYGILDFDVLRQGIIIYSEQAAQGASKIMRLDPNTGQANLLYDCPDALCMELAWRPDGKAFAFDRSELNSGTGLESGSPRIWIYDLTTGQASLLFTDPGQLGYMPRWSPDGKRIAFFDSGPGQVVIHNIVSGNDSFFQTSNIQVGTFSPDGRYLWLPKTTFSTDGQNVITHLVILDVSTDPPTPHNLIPDNQNDDDADPVWLPDSKTLIVLRIPSDRLDAQERQLYEVDVASGKATVLLDEPGSNHRAVNLNTAKDQITFQKSQDNWQSSQLWVYELKTTKERQIGNNGIKPHWLR